MFSIYLIYGDGSERRLVGFTDRASAAKFSVIPEGDAAIRAEIRDDEAVAAKALEEAVS